jgi:hypothetical protein
MSFHSFILQNQNYRQREPHTIPDQKIIGISDNKAYNKVITGKKNGEYDL